MPGRVVSTMRVLHSELLPLPETRFESVGRLLESNKGVRTTDARAAARAAGPRADGGRGRALGARAGGLPGQLLGLGSHGWQVSPQTRGQTPAQGECVCGWQ